MPDSFKLATRIDAFPALKRICFTYDRLSQFILAHRGPLELYPYVVVWLLESTFVATVPSELYVKVVVDMTVPPASFSWVWVMLPMESQVFTTWWPMAD